MHAESWAAESNDEVAHGNDLRCVDCNWRKATLRAYYKDGRILEFCNMCGTFNISAADSHGSLDFASRVETDELVMWGRK